MTPRDFLMQLALVVAPELVRAAADVAKDRRERSKPKATEFAAYVAGVR